MHKGNKEVPKANARLAGYCQFSDFANHPEMKTGFHEEELLRLAQDAHQKQFTFKAAKLYSRLLKTQPNHAVALNNLASILISDGKPAEAEELLRKTLELHPHYADAISNMAACEGHLRRWGSCTEWSHKGITIQPCNPMPWLWLARSHNAGGDTSEAINTLEKALRIDSLQEKHLAIVELAELYFSNGRRSAAVRSLINHYEISSKKDILIQAIYSMASRCGRTQLFEKAVASLIAKGSQDTDHIFWHAKNQLVSGEESMAIQLLMEVVRRKPQHAGAWMELGLILSKQNNYTKAIACLERSIKEDASNPETWKALSGCLINARRYKEAIRSSAAARKQFPSNLDILQTHCHALIDGDKEKLALRIIKETMGVIGSSHPTGLLNCEGLALVKAQEYSKAIDKFRKALKIARSDAGIWSNRGMAYGLLGRHRPEIFCYRKAIQCNPEDPGSHVNLAMAYLGQRKFHLGLKEYEWRLQKNNGSLNGVIQGELPNRQDKLDELLIVSEQGLGDTLQFVRYLHDLRYAFPSTRLILACPSKLNQLITSSIDCVDKVISCEESILGAKDSKYLPLMSLPHFCNLHPYESRAPKAYLKTSQEDADQARSLIREGVAKDTIIIGLNWKGNQETERTNLRGRSMNLEDMALITAHFPNAVFVSLQKGDGSEQIDRCFFRNRFTPNQSIISNEWSFTKTAGHVLACDHIITTDTSMAHLSGGLGQKTHVLLTSTPEWRWREDDEKSSWYPQTWLARQTEAGNWRGPLLQVIARIKNQNVLRS